MRSSTGSSEQLQPILLSNHGHVDWLDEVLWSEKISSIPKSLACRIQWEYPVCLTWKRLGLSWALNGTAPRCDNLVWLTRQHWEICSIQGLCSSLAKSLVPHTMASVTRCADTDPYGPPQHSDRELVNSRTSMKQQLVYLQNNQQLVTQL